MTASGEHFEDRARQSVSTNLYGAAGVEVFSTCPESRQIDARYLREVIDVAHWSEEFGCRGILVYTDNGLLDPWLVSQVIIENTTTLAPLIAIQPVYMHPYAAAKMVTTFAHLFGRRVYLNMLAGGFKNDLLALGDDTPHDERYDRMVEYALILRKLLESSEPVTFNGKYYTITKLKMTPPMPSDLFPGVISSGSSAAGMMAARTIGSVAVRYPVPPGEAEPDHENPGVETGVRVGIVARQSENEAWAVAEQRFPVDPEGQIKHQLAMKVSDSEWHKQLSAGQSSPSTERNPYWLHPFQNYSTFCPYLVGDYDQVAKPLAQYRTLGVKTFILDIPPSREELMHTSVAFRHALERPKQ